MELNFEVTEWAGWGSRMPLNTGKDRRSSQFLLQANNGIDPKLAFPFFSALFHTSTAQRPFYILSL
jgi:hypothetical protein